MKTSNIQITPISFILVSVFALIAILFGDVQAQQQSSWKGQQSQSQITQPQQGQQSASQQQSDTPTGRQGSSQSEKQEGVNLWKLDPQGTVRMGYDYNSDGIFDAFESITVYDLQKLQTQRQSQRASDRQGGDKYTGQGSQKEVKGKVIDVNTAQIANTGKTHTVAKINTDKGIAKIDLGPQENIASLNLQKGAHIKVFGIDGKINDNFILLADRLQVDGKRVNIDRSDSRPLHRLNAKVLNTRTLSREENKILMARVELQNGTKTVVNLGPQQQLPEISQGQQLQILARLTEVDGKKALIADRLRTNGQTYRVDWDEVRKQSS